jgi:hypothetical protein
MRAMAGHSDAYRRFIRSMNIGYDEWRDGTPYDLDALELMTDDERAEAEAMLVARPNRQWRDLQALVRLGTPAAMDAARHDRAHGDENTRLCAARLLREAGEADDLSAEIVSALEQDDTFGGLDQALDLAADHPTPAVVAALQRGAREAADDRGVHFAALLYYIRGKADEPFDWSRRPFFLRFRPEDPEDRARAYARMCAELGLEP